MSNVLIPSLYQTKTKDFSTLRLPRRLSLDQSEVWWIMEFQDATKPDWVAKFISSYLFKFISQKQKENLNIP